MEQKGSFAERRKFIRLKAIVEVNYAVIGKPGEIKAFSKNISAGGLCITTQEELILDTPLQLEIKIPDLKGPIPALGKVAWQKRIEVGEEQPKIFFDTGIEFSGISDFDRFNINRYVMDHIGPEK